MEFPIQLLIKEILFNIADLFIIFRLYGHLYGNPIVSKKRLFFLCFFLVTLITITLRCILAPFRPADLPPVTLLCSFLCFGCYEKAKAKKILCSALLFSFSCLYLITSDMVLTPLQMPFVNLVFHIGFWLSLEMIGHMGKYQASAIPYKLWGLLFTIALLSITAFCITCYFIIKRESPYEFTTEIPINLILIFINFCLFIFYDRFSALFLESHQKALLEQRLALQNAHYKELETAYKSLSSLRHDMKNYLRTAAALIHQEEDKEALQEFLTITATQFEQIQQMISTGNARIDSVLNIKFQEMLLSHIKLSKQLEVPAGISFSFEQSVTILGNLLDNAIEACLKLPEEKRFISVQIKYRNHTIYIRIENAALPIVKWKNGFPQSDKPNQSLHGIGLKNVSDMVSKQGTMEISAPPGTFLVQLVLYDC